MPQKVLTSSQYFDECKPLISGSLKVEGFSVDAFFLIDSATQSVEPTLRVKYEVEGLKMELYFATSLKGGEISCSEVSVITGSLEAGAYTRPLIGST